MSDEAAPPYRVEPETLAGYLVRCMVADLGFAPGTLPDASPLAGACDHVLTRHDGLSLTIACVVDRDRDPRTFGLEPEQVDAIAVACRRYAGALYGARQPVTIEIWEVGAGFPTDADVERLSRYTFRGNRRQGAVVIAVAVDSAAGTLISTAPQADSARRRAWFQAQLARPDRAHLPARPALAPIPQRAAVATWALLAAMVVAFVIELAVAPVPFKGALESDIRTHTVFGGLEHHRVAAGEWWRLFTSAFLHGDLMHLALNCVALFMAGSVLEKLVGRGWMLAVFFVGALAGSAMSLAINPGSLETVGASGAIMAMLAAGMLAALRLPPGATRSSILVSLGYILIPSLLPLFSGGHGEHVDYADHLGGALAGGVLGLAILACWPKSRSSPRGAIAAWVLTAAGAIVTIVGFGIVAAEWKQNVHDNVFELIPDEQVAHPNQITGPEAALLVARYPRDPRGHLLVAFTALKNQDLKVAGEAARKGLAEKAILERMLPPIVETGLREILALSLVDDDQQEAARIMAPVCKQPEYLSLAGPELRRQLCPP